MTLAIVLWVAAWSVVLGAAIAALWLWSRPRRRGHFMWCFSGRTFWPLDPDPADVAIEDVAHGLANECRYAGHVRWFYSVAEHSVLVSIHAAKRALELGWSAQLVWLTAIYGMTHDGSEAYVGDVIRPLKYQRTMRGYRRAEKKVQDVVERALLGPMMPAGITAIPDAVRELVEQIDSNMLTDEIAMLIPAADIAGERHKWGPELGADVLALGPREAEALFLRRWRDLVALDPAAAHT